MTQDLEEAVDALQWVSNVLRNKGLYNEYRVLKCVYLNIYTKTNGDFLNNLKNIISLIENHPLRADPSIKDEVNKNSITFDELGVPSLTNDCKT